MKVCKTVPEFINAAKEKVIASVTVSETYRHMILIRATLHHCKALFVTTTVDGQKTFEITGYDRRK